MQKRVHKKHLPTKYEQLVFGMACVTNFNNMSKLIFCLLDTFLNLFLLLFLETLKILL